MFFLQRILFGSKEQEAINLWPIHQVGGNTQVSNFLFNSGIHSLT